MRRRAFWLLTPALLACGEEPRVQPAVAEEPGAAVSWGDAAVVEPVPAQVFLRKPVPEAGPGRALLHVLVPAEATAAQVRQALTGVLRGTAEQDTTLIALRAVAYILPRARAGEVELTPSAWGEWLPPEGWDGATEASRHRFHRVYTYFGAPPAW